MGVLSQKCVKNYPTEDDPEGLELWGNIRSISTRIVKRSPLASSHLKLIAMRTTKKNEKLSFFSDENWDYFMHNDSNWWVDVDGESVSLLTITTSKLYANTINTSKPYANAGNTLIRYSNTLNTLLYYQYVNTIH